MRFGIFGAVAGTAFSFASLPLVVVEFADFFVVVVPTFDRIFGTCRTKRSKTADFAFSSVISMAPSLLYFLADFGDTILT